MYTYIIIRNFREISLKLINFGWMTRIHNELEYFNYLYNSWANYFAVMNFVLPTINQKFLT